MSNKKAHTHIKKPIFVHPAQDISFISILESVPDPRNASPNFSYSLLSILFMAITTLLCGAKDLRGHERVISLIEPSLFKKLFMRLENFFG